MITTNAMLVNLTISQWTARKYDKKVSRSVEEANEANDAGRFNKLLIDKKAIELIARAAGKGRDFLYENTLPWGDNGDRLLPASMYFKFTEGMRERREAYNTAVNNFIKQYPDLCTAARKRLGKMYDPNDYPHVDTLRHRFEWRLSFANIPDAGDFRVDMEAAAANDVKQAIQEAATQREQEAANALMARAKAACEHMYTRLIDKDAIFRDSLVTNIEVLTELMPQLNVMKHDNIDTIAKDMKEHLIIPPDRLRQDKMLRHETALHARRIADLLP